MTTKPKSIECPECKGAGKIELQDHLQQAFDALPSRGTSTAEAVARILEIEHGSACNRLRDLYDLGLVLRTRKGREWLYSRV